MMSTKKTSLNLLLYFLVLNIFLNLLICPKLNAEILHWPQICFGENSGELHIKNNSSKNTSVWIQKFNKTLLSEIEVPISAKSNFILALDSLANSERYSLLNMNQPSSIEVKYKCHQNVYSSSSIEGGELTFRKSSFLTNKIWIQNLYTDVNHVKIEFQDINFNKIAIEELSLAPSISIQFSIPNSIINWAYFKISSSHKSSIFNLTSTGADRPIQVTPVKTQVDPDAFYFLVESRSGSSDSFIVKITQPSLVESARELVKNPQKEKILFARIQKDHQGFNRNWSKPEKNFWSWSTSEVTSFGDIGSTVCNGSPQEVEDRTDFWVEDPGRICFWNYRIRKELSPQNVESGF